MTLVVGQHPPLGAFFNATPFPWLGGKTALAPRIIPYFPPHALYVEPYGGAANVLLNKNPATTVVVIDEVNTDNWGIKGEQVTELRKQTASN